MRNMTAALVAPLALVLIASACAPPAATPTEPGVPSELPEPVEAAVLTEVSEMAGIQADEVEVVDAEAEEWPDACLGLPEDDEVCAQVITPGWRVTVQAGEETYVVRTNEDGTAVRVE